MKKIAAIILLLFVIATTVLAQVSVKNLLCENLSNPVGLDSKLPRFSWQLISDKRNVMQVAYEIKVTNNKSTAWSSGKVITDKSVQVLYGGIAVTI